MISRPFHDAQTLTLKHMLFQAVFVVQTLKQHVTSDVLVVQTLKQHVTSGCVRRADPEVTCHLRLWSSCRP